MNYNTKYKDRKPEDTIQILENFFQFNGYKLQVQYRQVTELNIYSCHIMLLLNENCIENSNGKGISKIFAYASGLAELYERFCNKLSYFQHPIFVKKFIEKNQKDFGYNFHPKEKILTIQDILQNEIISTYLQLISPNNINETINLLCDNKIIGLPYQGFNIQEIQYFDPRIIYHLYTSTGMASGNTIEEALNQGISEIFERYCFEQFCYNINKQYHSINLDNIQNNHLKTLIKKILKNYKFFVLDLSYNFNLPVIATIFIGKINNSISIGFGSFPDFEIALERCITEFFQGEEKLNNNLNLFTTFETSIYLERIAAGIGTYKNFSTFNLDIIQNLIEENYPSKIYIKNKSNLEINNYYKKLLNTFNIKCFYYDCSLCDDIKALHIFFDNFYVFKNNLNIIKNIPEKNKNIIHNNIKFELQILNNNFNFSNYNKIIFYQNYEVLYWLNFLGRDWLQPYQSNYISGLHKIKSIYEQDIDELLDIYYKDYAFEQFFYLKYLAQYLFIKKNAQKKSSLIISEGKIFDYDITEEDCFNIYNPEYNINRYILEPFFHEINSFEYNEIFLKSHQFKN